MEHVEQVHRVLAASTAEELRGERLPPGLERGDEVARGSDSALFSRIGGEGVAAYAGTAP